MEKEISSGAMLGIVLIALAAIIGIGFGVFAIAKGTANTGVTNVQEKLEGVSQSEYTDYDQTIVTGTQVKSAYDNFAGKNVAVLIATQATKDAIDSTTGILNKEAAGIDKAYAAVNPTQAATNVAKNVPYVAAYSDDTLATGYAMTTSKGTAISKPVFINYNALLASPTDPTKYSANVTGDSAKIPQMYFDTNCFRSVYGYCTVAGKTQFNYISGNLAKSGMVEFLPTSARFQAYLIKDASGTTLGVAFDQISSK